VPLWFDYLRGLLERDREGPQRACADWTVRFLADDAEGRDGLLQVLLVCPHVSTRREFVQLVSEAMDDLHDKYAPGGYLRVGGATGRELIAPTTRLLARLIALLQLCSGASAHAGHDGPKPGMEMGTGMGMGMGMGPLSTTPYRPAILNFYLTPETLRLLVSVALIGAEERRLLLDMEVVPWLTAFVASLEDGENRGLMFTSAGEECLSNAVRILCLVIDKREPGGWHTPANLEGLSNRKFLEMAVGHYPQVRVMEQQVCRTGEQQH
jgi:hypothetical protein